MVASADARGAGGVAPASLGLDAGLERAGLNLAGVLGRARYDALVAEPWRAARVAPDAASALLVAAGGPALFRAFRTSPQARDAALRDPVDAALRDPVDAALRDPLDTFVARAVDAACAGLQRAGASALAFGYAAQREGRFADFGALACEAGLGAPGRLGILLHPVYGPWLSVRALVLTSRALPETRPAPGFAPCEGCPAPCAAACHGAVLGAPTIDLEACMATRRLGPPCAERCDARRACVLGPEHAYDVDAQAFHARAVLRADAARAGGSRPQPGGS